MRLKDKICLVTGAAQGIGAATCERFAAEGATVIACDRRAPATPVPGAAAFFEVDVTDRAAIDAMVAAVLAQHGGIDVLVNNAGFQLHAKRLEDLTDEHLQETLQTNVAGYIHMARACLPHMQRGASIVNCGSVTGLFGSPQLIDYSATKGAVHAFTKALAANLLERGIRVNAVAPGPVWTPFNPADKPADEVAAFGKDSAMGRPAQPEELSPAFVFLASPVMSSYVNGIVLPVMGGPKG